MRTRFKRHGRHFHGWAALVLWALAATLLPSMLRAEDPAPTSQPAAETTTKPAAESSEATVDTTPPPVPVKKTSAEEVQALSKRVEQSASTTLDDKQKDEALTALREAKTRLDEMETWKTRAATFRERLKNAPQELQRLKQTEGASQTTTQPTSQPTTTSAPVEDVTLSDLEAQLRAEQSKLDNERTRVANAEEALARRSAMLTDGPKQVSDTQNQLTTLEATPVNADGPDLLVEARRTRRTATRMSLEAKVDALQAELKYYENTGELLQLERDRAVQRRDALEASVKSLRAHVAALRQQAAEQAKEKAEDVSTRVRRIFPAINELIDENKALAEARSEMSQRIANLATVDQGVQDEAKRVSTKFDEAKDLEKTSSVSNNYGVLLRTHLATLPNLGDYRRRLEKRQTEIGEAELKATDYKFKLDPLSNLDARFREWAAKLPDGLSERDKSLVLDEIKRQLELKKENLRELHKRTYIDELNDLTRDLAGLIRTTEEFETFINERILWVRSGQPIGADKFKGLLAALAWFGSADNWGTFLNAAADYYAGYWFLLLPGVAVFLVLMSVRRAVRRRLRLLAAKANEPLSTDFKVTLASCFHTLLLALPYPLLLWFAGQAFQRVPEAGDFAKAVAGGFNSAALTAFPLLLLIHICRVHGLAGAHLGWDAKAIGILRRNLIWFVGAIVPVSFVVGMLASQGVEDHSETFGRDVFILGMIFITIFLARVLRPRSGALTQFMIEHPHGRLTKLRYLIYAIVIVIPIALAAGAALGYYYTVLRLSARYWLTAIIWISAIIVYLLLMRWLLLARRKIAIDQANRKRAEAKAKAEAKAEAERAARKEGAREEGEHVEAPPATVQVEEPTINIPSLSQQTRQLIGSLTIFAVVMLTFAVWVREMPALGVLRDIQIGELGISVADVGLALIAAVVSIIAVRNIPALLEISVLAHLPIDAGTRYAISAISRYVIGTIGIIVTFALVNIGWSKVQWLIAAVSVGLGFGLQEIFANFVSGLIILFERPIRIGDTVTVGSQTGTVSRIRIRATCITDWDNKELVIPNKRFVTDEITNWTLSNQILRLVVPVGVSYSSNPRQVRDVLMDVVKTNGKVLDDPSPRVYFLGFGDSALNFECRAYFKNFDDLLVGRHQLYVEIFEACQKNDIEIAFPQRDIHIRSINATLPLKPDRARPEKLENEEGNAT